MTSSAVINGANRNWTTSEEADLSAGYGSSTPAIRTIVDEDFAVVVGGMSEWRVLLFAIGDNLYVAHVIGTHKIYWTNSLKDAFDFAAETITHG